MPKFIPYESPMDFLARKIDFFESLQSTYYKYNKFDNKLNHEGRNPNSSAIPYLLGGLNPLLAMNKDLVDTFKPYKSKYYVLRDLMQPISGLGNIIRGAFNLVVAPLIFLFNIANYTLRAIRHRDLSGYFYNMSRNFTKFGGGMLDGVTSILRGITQIFTTPLTWLVKIPLRGLITLVKGAPTAHQNINTKAEKLSKLINKDNKTLSDCVRINRIIKSIPTKLDKAEKRGQAIGGDSNTIKNTFNSLPSFLDQKCVYGFGRTLVFRSYPKNSPEAKDRANEILNDFHNSKPAGLI